VFPLRTRADVQRRAARAARARRPRGPHPARTLLARVDSEHCPMRHFLANVATYGIAGLLVVGAALFAWARSSQLTVTDEVAVLAQYEPHPSGEFRWQDLGARSYERNCSTCHLRDGSGWDQYPPLDHTRTLAAADGGR